MNTDSPSLSQAMQVQIGNDGIAEIIFGPAGHMPVADAATHARLATVWNELAANPAVRCILVRSIGKGFCAGGDMQMVQTLLDSEQARQRVMHEARELVRGMVECPVPIVSAINGAAVGAGAALALLADISIAAHNAKIIDGHTRIGVAAGDHATLIWPLLCGMARAKYYLLTCATVSGSEAERIGLVSLAVPDAELASRAREVAVQLAAGSRAALAGTKRVLNDWLRAAWPAFEQSLALEFNGFASADAREGIAASMARRPATFS